MTTTAAPQNLIDCAAELRTLLSVPEKWVEVVSHENGDWCVSVALAVSLEDMGGPESGPSLSMQVSRWVDVVPPAKGHGWALHLFVDEPEEDPYYSVMPKAMLYLEPIAGSQVAGAIVASWINDIFTALGVKPQEAS